MKTTREIIDALDVMGAYAAVFRGLVDYAGQKKPWDCTLKIKRDGVSIEIASQNGATFDEALAAAWAKFEPAVSQGLPQAVLAAPVAPAHEDADFDEVDF